jgi:phosphonate transport system substrate-binding protein
MTALSSGGGCVRPRSTGRPGLLHVAHCLSPHLGDCYAFVASHLAASLDRRVEFHRDAPYERLADVDIAFVCSLAYIAHPLIAGHFEPVAAPVLVGERYRGEPIYYSDVIVHRDSALRSFDDLRGRSWAYNEVYSQSGYGITRYHLACINQPHGYFGRVVEAGRHDLAIRMVAERRVDAAAIDSHHLATYLRRHPDLASSLHVIHNLGPSPIQPVVVRRNMPVRTKEAVRAALLEVGCDADARTVLAEALIDRFVPIDDTAYNAVRRMRDTAAGVTGLGVVC